MSPFPEWEVKWIDTDTELQSLVEILKQEEVISVDTETVGWETGNEKLCLIQLGIPTKSLVAIVDPLSISDLKPLEPILSTKTPLLVAHNASFEERQFSRHGIKLRGVVDTLNMARRLRPDLPNHTLQTCCRLLLNLEISKEEQTSNWSQRPLTPNQLKYAALDAEVTMALYLALHEMELKLEIDPTLNVSGLMEALSHTVRDRILLTKEIATALAFSQAREEMIREAIRAKLVSGEPPYEGVFGKCHVTQIKKTQINPEKVKNEFPNIANLVISEHVEKEVLLSVMKEHGIDEKALDLVLDVTGYVDRMYLTLKDVV